MGKSDWNVNRMSDLQRLVGLRPLNPTDDVFSPLYLPAIINVMEHEITGNLHLPTKTQLKLP